MRRLLFALLWCGCSRRAASCDASPDSPGYWRAARELGLDFINADDLAGLRATLDVP